jgi:hypothetical protein
MYRLLKSIRVLAGLLAMSLLLACTADNKWASDAEVARARYVDPNPTSITLFTSMNTRNNAGAHAAVMINGNERVLFDPAGSFAHPTVPERHDMLYGITPSVLGLYVDFQGTAPFEVIQQTIFVTPEVAEQVRQTAISYGAANKAACTRAVSSVLRSVPGFESLPSTWFPKKLSRGFAALPGVITRKLTSLDGDLRRTLPGSPLIALPEG